MKSLPCPRYCNDFHISFFFFFFSSPRLIDGMYALLSQYQGENNNAFTSIALNSTGVQKHYNKDSLSVFAPILLQSSDRTKHLGMDG